MATSRSTDRNPSHGAAQPEAPRRTFFGRRKGRKLRRGRQHLLDDLLPQLAVDLPAPGTRLDPAELFDPPRREIWLEIGFGGGEHLAWQAESHARRDGEIGLIGVEFFVNGIAALLSRLRDSPARDSVRIYQGDARDLLAALPAACLRRVFVLFPDPWPKLRHHKRRLIRRSTLDGLARVMVPGGELRIATDDQNYLTWILERLIRHPGFEWLAERPGDWRFRPGDWPPTRYEEKALDAGRRPSYLRFRRSTEGLPKGPEGAPDRPEMPA